MGTVMLAACKIANILFGLPPWQTIVICGVLNVVFAAHAGLWGVLVIDMIQFFIKMTAVIAAALLLAGRSRAADRRRRKRARAACSNLVGSARIATGEFRRRRPAGDLRRSTAPDSRFSTSFRTLRCGTWRSRSSSCRSPWAGGRTGIRDAEPGGGSYIAQRMLASKSEKDSLGGTLFFNLAHYVLRPWPWIITALCSIIVFPELKDIQAAFPAADPRAHRPRQRVSGDAEVPARRVRRPDGGRTHRGEFVDHPDAPQLGLVVSRARLLSPVRPPRRAGAALRERRPRRAPCCSTSSRGSWPSVLESAQEAFQIIISIGAGTGLLYLLRWFWWRINAWCEIVAMVSSFAVSVTFFVLAKNGHGLPFAQTILISVGLRRCAGWSRPSSRRRPIRPRWSRSTRRCSRPVRAGRRFARRGSA